MIGGVFTIDFQERTAAYGVGAPHAPHGSQTPGSERRFYVGDHRCSLVRVAWEALTDAARRRRHNPIASESDSSEFTLPDGFARGARPEPQQADLGHRDPSRIRVASDEFTDDDAAPPLAFPMIVFYGPAGSGKSLLVEGCRSLWKTTDGPGAVAYSGSSFSRAYGLALETNSLPAFRHRLHQAAAFFLDDVHQLANRPHAQEELVHVIDALQQRRVPIVFTLRQAPGLNTGLSPALISRLSAGLVVPLQTPGREGLRAIAERLAAQQNICFNAETLERLLRWAAPEETGSNKTRRPSLAEFVTTVHRIATLLNLRKGSPAAYDPGRESAAIAPSPRNSSNAAGDRGTTDDQILDEILDRELRTNPIELRTITSTVARYFDQTTEELRGPGRRRGLVHARNIAIYLARQLTEKNLNQLGKYFGGRDHTTIMHACRRVAALLEEDPSVRRAIDELRSQFHTMTRTPT